MISGIVILAPKGERINIFSGYELPQLGNVLLATILRDRGYEEQAFFPGPPGDPRPRARA